jgi:hypothetical protein
MNMLWRPNIYFANARHSQYHDITERNFLTWISPEGNVTYDTRCRIVWTEKRDHNVLQSESGAPMHTTPGQLAVRRTVVLYSDHVL